MTNTQATQPPPPPAPKVPAWKRKYEPRQIDESKGVSHGAAIAGWAVVVVAGWAAALYFVSQASESEDPMRDYFFGLIFAIIASAVAIVVTLYDIAGRDDR